MKIYSFLTILIVVCLALIPPIDFIISNPQHPYWLWMILIAGFFGVFTLFIKTDWPVKAIAVLAFINCFFSAAPYLSFTSYVSVVFCCYLYIVAARIEDWNLMYKCLASLVCLQVLIMTMQYFHKDDLLNFGLYQVEHFGTIGHRMQMASLAVVLSAILIGFNINFIVVALAAGVFCNSAWTFISVGVAAFVYFYHRNKGLAQVVLMAFLVIFGVWASHSNKFMENINSKSGRLGVWDRSIQLANQRPLTGWGIGTYKDIFPPLSGMECIPWRTAHNFIIQLVFEVGYPLTGCLLFGLGWLVWLLYTNSLRLLLSGLCLILTDGLVHFPDRMIQTVPLIIIFFAYIRFNMARYT